VLRPSCYGGLFGSVSFVNVQVPSASRSRFVTTQPGRPEGVHDPSTVPGALHAVWETPHRSMGCNYAIPQNYHGQITTLGISS
jgi:hypothetical protein